MIGKILVALDYSEDSTSIFDTAVALAKTANADLMLLHVLDEKEPGYPIIPSYTYYPILDNYDYELYRQKLQSFKQKGIKFLQQKAKEARDMGVKTEFLQKSGHPGHSICELAFTSSADLIVVGSRGLKGLKEMFLGSVSNYVTHHAPCSVLIVRQPIDSELEQSSADEVDKSELLTSDS